MDRFEKITNHIESLIHAFKSNLDLIEINSAFRWTDIGWNVPPGARTDFEIKYVVRGQTNLQLAGDSSIGIPGDLFFVDNHKGHRCEHGNFTLFSFSFTVQKETTAGKALYETIQEIFRRLPIKIKLEIHGRMIRRYTEIIKDISLKPYGYELNLKFFAIQLFIEVARVCLVIQSSASNITPYQYNKYSEVVTDIIVYLQEHTEVNIDLQELGSRYMLNPRYLNRIFKGATGYPIFRYHQMIKVEKAKKLLSTSSLNVLEIALELGFESSQSFSKFYKKMTLLAPSEFRKMST
ncbi:helix-turn-helix domain-containing protein [Paenibacillus eucommiae]|uniref:AraC-like DNA-binding protein n=1 Tax=Paenibacillus eucommiae TaxID=1355755 RepID=A0ABS4IUC0_9BACL|nr:AraC family transcriptional regulator [Paenibacillus eucommiae]MBP1990616.1 AraC-like DNA-binding protein [Paenibacillus eucommiae]